jgi:hypothetical protein
MEKSLLIPAKKIFYILLFILVGCIFSKLMYEYSETKHIREKDSYCLFFSAAHLLERFYDENRSYPAEAAWLDIVKSSTTRSCQGQMKFDSRVTLDSYGFHLEYKRESSSEVQLLMVNSSDEEIKMKIHFKDGINVKD